MWLKLGHANITNVDALIHVVVAADDLWNTVTT
jgi:hypothetical protein